MKNNNSNSLCITKYVILNIHLTIFIHKIDDSLNVNVYLHDTKGGGGLKFTVLKFP